MMKNRTLGVFVLISVVGSLMAQNEYQLTLERIVEKPTVLKNLCSQCDEIFSGVKDGNLIYEFGSHRGYCRDLDSVVVYSEKTETVTAFPLNINLKEKTANNEKILGARYSDKITVQAVRVFPEKYKETCNPYELEDIPIMFNVFGKGYECRLDYQQTGYEVTDTYICQDGDFFIVSTCSGDDMKDSHKDTIIIVYDFNKIKDKIPDKIVLPWKECSNTQIVDGYIYFSKKYFYMPGSDSYDWQIYRAPLYDFDKRELIASFIDLYAVSPDGKYLIGKKRLHRKNVFVIVDVKTGLFQYLLGRDYTNFSDYRLFFSPTYMQFAFDSKKHLLYIDYPEVYPFDATDKTADLDLMYDDNEPFWGKFKHKELK